MSEKKESFLQRKNVTISFQRYGIQAMGAMALGLFASLLIGTIIKTVAEQIYTPPVLFSAMLKLSGDDLAAAVAGLSTFGNFAWILYQIGNYATAVTGAAMAIAIGQSLQAPPLVLQSARQRTRWEAPAVRWQCSSAQRSPAKSASWYLRRQRLISW